MFAGSDSTRHPDAAERTDAALIAASVTDSAAFAVLYQRHAAVLHGYAVRRLGGQLAQDVVADAVLAAFAARDRYDQRWPDARPWLLGILSNKIARQHRAEQRRYRALARVPAERPEEPTDRVLSAVSARALHGRLAGAMAGLRAGDRDVLLLIAWAELSYEEVAQALRIPLGTVRSRLHRARTQVRTALGDLDARPDAEEA